MKYLNKRDEFLTSIRQVKIQDFKLNESVDMTGSGPFNNDTPWGDTLVGRLVNAIRRKIGIGVNMVRIQPLIIRLRAEFDNILEYSIAGQLSDEDKKKVAMILICTIVRDIKLAIVDQVSSGATDSDDISEISEFAVSDKKMTPIKDEDYLKEVDSIITEVILLIKDISSELGEIDNQDELIGYLEELREQVKELKKKFKGEEGSTENEEEEEGKESKEKIFNDNFKTVAQLVIAYKSEKDKKAELFKGKQVAGKEVGKEVVGAQLGKEVAGKEVVGAQLGKEVQAQNKNLSRTMDSFSYRVNEQSNAPSPVMSQLRKLHDTFISIEPDTISELQKYLKMSEENQLSTKFSSAFVRIYTYIRKKQGINERLLIKEDLNVLLSNDSKLGEAILGLYNVTKQKPDGSFEGISDELKKIVAGFNSTMTKCLSKELKTSETKEGQKESEETNKNISDVMDSYKPGKLLRYTGFKRINEADEAKQNIKDATEVNKENQKTLLTAYWEEIWETKISKILLTNDKYKELRKEVDKLNAEVADSLTIDGIDPIISVLKLFNRAYKLYTVNSIPGGRSGGKISRSVSNEYTPVGGGGFGSGENLSGTDGPYRNNRIFNMWENAVLDIKSERKYQQIFSKRTNIRIGNEMRKEAGPIFLKMMNDLLDGSKLYGQGKTGDGAQREFIEKYFGTEAVGDVKSGDLTLGGDNEAKEIQDTASKVKSTELNFEKKDFEIRSVKDNLRRTIVRLEVQMSAKEGITDEEKEKLNDDPEYKTQKRYFFVVEGNDDVLYVIHSSSFFHLNRYIRNDFEKKGIEVTFKEAAVIGEPERKVYLTKMKPRNFNKMLQQNAVVNLVGTGSDETSSKEIGKQKTVNKKWLCEVEGLKQYKLENYSFKNSKGFQTDKLASIAKESTM